MSSHRFIAGLLSCISLLPLAAGEIRAQSKPNIIFILADDLGWGDLSVYGHDRLKTPNLDRMAAEGTLFTQFYVNGSVCSPSRAAFFTGQYPARHRIHGHYATREMNEARGMSSWLEPKTPNIAALLRGAGYRTAHIGKWHLGNDANGPATREYGFDFVGTSEGGAGVRVDDPYFRARSSALFVDEALKFIREDRDKPFYIQLWMLVPHATLNPTEEQMKPFERFSSINVPHRSAETIYYASVTDLDAQVGRLMSELEKLGRASDTILVFSSDNGPEDIHIRNASHSGVGSAGPFRGRKRSLYEVGARVPLMVVAPKARGNGKASQRVVQSLDLYPTLAELCGLPTPDGLAGHSLAPLLANPNAKWDHPAYTVTRFQNKLGRAVRTERWRYAEWPAGEDGGAMLFDRAKDPHELKNLAGDPAYTKTVDEMKKLLKRLP